MANTGIEWTDQTWNPSTGCSKVSSGCKFCYAENMALRLKAMGSVRYENGFDFTIHADKVDEPRKWRKPRRVFVDSMSDLFHEDAPLDFLRRIFRVMMDTPQHQYQILTKRPERMAMILSKMVDEGIYTPSNHIWLGTSVEDATVQNRIQFLRETPAQIRFLSCEPLIGPLSKLNLKDIHWVIVGGESGSHLWRERTRRRRGLVERIDGAWVPVDEKVTWVRRIRDQCIEQKVAFFFKQWGGNTSKSGGRMLDGKVWSQFPEL
ncbi:phage Gp37/Gp68 family protein [Lujinxingia vulgaris]|uniref:Phage Gp37/Gp68 family protein n=1 Tax=Lujinxingia vulgaris TaxID=2600176 RepID=A0A5C6X7N3_9DELT|nr:phage Gp37/Gp68 family protein [Lujinxingia vulgaris]TXD34035.1 phage Gp37/Gp68 family protein [Lujinxingia vulgaris]